MSHGDPNKLRFSPTMGKSILLAMPDYQANLAEKRYDEGEWTHALAMVWAIAQGSDVRVWCRALSPIRIIHRQPLPPTTRFVWECIVHGREKRLEENQVRRLRHLMLAAAQAEGTPPATRAALRRRSTWIADRLDIDAVERLADLA